jgi:uncharacterized protein (DUF362 family)
MAGSRVVIVHSPGIVASSGDLDRARLIRMFETGLRLVTGAGAPDEAAAAIFKPGDRVGIKINTIGGRALSTRPETALALAGVLTRGGVAAENVVVWDRTNRELREAGFKLSDERGAPRVYGTDTAGSGYGRDLIAHREVGSLFSLIQADFVTASISLAILKDHGLAGVTAGMKNYFGAIHNPNKYHDHNCDPFIADLSDVPAIKDKHRLSVLDALRVQYHRGPSSHPRWAEPCEALIFSRDPVAADAVGRDLIERLRAGKGLPSLAEEGRPPRYLETAERLGLGTSRTAAIEVVEAEA